MYMHFLLLNGDMRQIGVKFVENLPYEYPVHQSTRSPEGTKCHTFLFDTLPHNLRKAASIDRCVVAASEFSM